MQISDSPGKVVCIGASLVDLTFSCTAPPLLHTSNPAKLHRSPGGVMRNIAHHLALLGCRPELITVLGNDPDGKWLADSSSKAGILLNHTVQSQEPTGVYTSVIGPDGDLVIGAAVSDTDLLLTSETLRERTAVLKAAQLIIADCNLSAATLKWLLTFCEQEEKPLILETVSIPKADRLNKALPGKVLMMKPNAEELDVFGPDTTSFYSTDERIEWLHRQGVQNVWISQFEKGSTLSDGKQRYSISAPSVNVQDTTGAGDAAMAGWAWAYLRGFAPEQCVRYGHAAAGAILEVKGAIRHDLLPELLESYLS